MSVKLLESVNTPGNAVVINPADGAALNLLASGQKDGRVWGARISCSNGVFTATEGLIIARGYRIKIDSTTTILDLSSQTYPAQSTKYRLIARVTRVGDNASVSFASVSVGSSINQNSIERSAGTFDLVCGTFYASPTSHGSEYEDSLATVTGASSSGSSSGSAAGIGKVLQPPRLEIVRKSGGDHFLCIKNFGDYAGYVNKYTVRIRLWQFLKRVKRRYPSSSECIKFWTTGWRRPESAEGLPTWQYAKDVSSIHTFVKVQWDVTETHLDIVRFESASATYVRRDVLLNIDEDLIEKLFYWEDNSNPNESNLHPMSELGELANTYWPNERDLATYSIRCTNSKREKRTDRGPFGKIAYNCFKRFAFEVYIYDGSKLVARSGLGDSLVLTPNLGNVDAPIAIRIK